MEYSLWEPEYVRILKETGFRREDDEAAARVLEEMLRGRESPLRRLRAELDGKEVVIVGAAPIDMPIPDPGEERVIIAADGGTSHCLKAGFCPRIIVTDLDGYVPDEVRASARGSLTLVHAHGDNIEALRRWVPGFPGEVGGSVAGAPRENMVNFGGFTDGDRALFLAEAMGARAALLTGFDLSPHRSKGKAEALRQMKLDIARRLIDGVAVRGLTRVELLARGGIREWPVTLP